MTVCTQLKPNDSLSGPEERSSSCRPSAGGFALEPLEGRKLLAGSGLASAYFARTNLTAPKFSRVDSTVNFEWAGGTPAASLGTDGFSTRWVGRVMPKFSEIYSFIATSTGGLRLWVNNALLIDAWSSHASREDIGRIKLSAGKLYDIRIDYWSDGKSPAIQLDWQSARRSRELVPKNRLYAAALDRVAPSTPDRFRTSAATDSTISLTWNPSSDPSGVVGYELYVGSTKVGTTAPGQMSYTRTQLKPKTGYTFSVQAIDAAGNVSRAANTAATTAASSANRAPTAPGGLQVSGTSKDSISLRWTASSDDHGVTGYRVYRNGVKIAATTALSFTDTGLSQNTTYSYYVRAADAGSLYSAPSNTVSAQTAAPIARDAFAGISAGDYDSASGVSRSGGEIYGINTGSWVGYSDVNFGSGAGSVRIDVSLPPSNVGGSIELHLDSIDGPKIGTFYPQATGAWDTYYVQQTGVSGASGSHDLYLLAKGGSGICNIRSVRFSTRQLTRIMPLGDSITQGWNESPNYRSYLWDKLWNAGYYVDFVGGESKPWDGGNFPNLNFDQNNEGHANIRADQIADNVATWASTNRSDIVLLHAGSNDILQGQSTDSTIADLGRIIDGLRSANPSVKILLAQIIPLPDFETQVADLNGQIPGLAASKSTAQSPVIVVDQNSGFDSNNDIGTFDGKKIHPNASGDSKIADRWYAALTELL